MNIEEEIFKKCIFDFAKLKDYGFKKIDEVFILKKDFLDNFVVAVEISFEGCVKGRIIDKDFNEEYFNYRMATQTGEYVRKIREKYKILLKDIRDKCTIKNDFIGGQANRISEAIYEKYGDKPEFLWDKSPDFGVFRNSINNKWYGLIMNIRKDKLDEGLDYVEIINAKLNNELIKKLLKRKGFYKAYHMNKENWISILLDDSVSDEEIMCYIDESHSYT